MRIITLLGLLIYFSSCNYDTNSKKTVLLDSNINKEIREIKYDYMAFDSVFINCQINTSTKLDSLIKVLGEPDTIIKYKDTFGFSGDPYSYVKFNNATFHLFDNGQAQLRTIQLDNYSICYKKFEFSNLTNFEQISKIFPNSYYHRDTITIGNENLVAIRLNTSNRATDSQWIFLFFNNNLKYFNYFDGDD